MRRFRFALVLGLILPLLSGPAWSEEASSFLLDMLQQLQQMKAKADAVTPGDRSGANRLTRQMRLYKSRLSGVRTKGAPEYQQAVDLYNDITTTLEAKASGQAAPAAAAAPAAPKPAAPAAPAAAASEPHPDPKLEAALAEIIRLEGELEQMQPGDKATANGLQRSLNQQRTPIQATRDKTHPRWNEAANRYNALQKEIVAKANQPAPAGTASGGSGGTPPATAAPSDPKVAEALAKVTDYEAKLQGLAPGDKATAQGYLDDLKGVVPLLQGAQDKSHPSWKQTLARYNALNDGITARANQSPDAIPTDGLRSHELVKVKRMARKVLSAEATIKKAPGPEFRDPARAKEFEDLLASVDMEILNFSQPGHPSMAAMTRLVQRTRGVLKQKVERTRQEVAALGNLDADLSAIRGRMKSGGNPPAIDENTAPDQAVAMVKAAIARDAQYAKDLAYLDKVHQSGYGPRDIGSMTHWIGDRRQKNLDSVVGSRDRLATQIDADMRTVEFYTKLDPLNAHQRSNNFLMEGRYDEVLDGHEKILNRIAVLDAILTTLNDQKRLAETAKAKEAIIASREKYKKNYIVALGAVRMPKAAKHDDEMVEAAKAVLSNPKYEGVHKILRMVINTPKRRQEIMETSIRGTVTGASATSNMKVWDEFQVTTAEELPSGEVYKFFTTIKYFHKGGSTTPTGRWLMSGRFKGERILKENVDK